MLWNHLREKLKAQGEAPPPDTPPESVGGGCICSSYHWGPYFIKTHQASHLSMFQSEHAGLTALANSGRITTPKVFLCGKHTSTAYLVLEHLDMGGSPNPKQLGMDLTRMHRDTANQMPQSQFGWSQDNFIGSTPQNNTWINHWAEFWKLRRIEPMLQRCADAGFSFQKSRTLLDRIPEILDAHDPSPSLVHGDLWTGNAAYLTNMNNHGTTPVLFDPAVYYGDREVDLAMSELFGNFGPEFWRGVEEVWPLSPGYPKRRELYNLYHILNHTVLFGSSYAGQAQAMIHQLCR